MATPQHQSILDMLDESDVMSSASMADSVIPAETPVPDSTDLYDEDAELQDPNIIEHNLDIDSIIDTPVVPNTRTNVAKCPAGFVGRYPYCERVKTALPATSVTARQDSAFDTMKQNPVYAIVGTLVIIIAITLVYKWSRDRNDNYTGY